MELCIHFQSCKTRSLIKEYNQIEYISGQSECPYEVDIPKVENPAVDNSEVDNPEVDDPEVDKSKVDNPFVSPYQCNMTGMCIVSHKHRVQNHNVNAQTTLSAFVKGISINHIDFLQGIQGKEQTTKGTDTAKTCQEKCKNKQDCHWHSYNKEIEVCAHFKTCTAMNDQTDYVSSQSECSDSILELEDTKLDNPRLDNLYQCNVTGVCQVSYKPTAYYNLIVLTS